MSPSGDQQAPSLTRQVLVAIAAGVAVGLVLPAWGTALKPLGDVFIQLVKALIAPVIFVTVASGIAGMGELRSVGRVGLKAFVYFEAVTTLALALGWAVARVFEPGKAAGLRGLPLDARAVEPYTTVARDAGIVPFLMGVVPDSFVGAFVRGDTLQVLVMAVLTGLALAALGDRGQPARLALEHVSTVLFTMIGLVMRLAPVGAFGAMAFTVGKFGTGTLVSLATLVACAYGTCALFVAVVLGGVTRLAGLSLWRLLRYLREELALVLGTSSSEPALPRLLLKLENLGCGRRVVGLVVPSGYAFNLDGTSIYLTLGALFIAQATGTSLSPWQEATLLGVALVTSKGAAAVTGGGFVTLAATLTAVPVIPPAGLALLLGVDRFMSEARALTNFVGNAVATIVVSRWEGDFDAARARAVLKDA